MPPAGSVRIGLVLSAGGLRGAAHLGVLRAVTRHGIPISVVVGTSAGAIIASYYAAVGLSVEEMVGLTPAFRGRHIVMHGLTLRAHRVMKPFLRKFCGIIPDRLAQLDAASFERLHHGIDRLGIVCHDLGEGRPWYFSSTESFGVRLADVARASAAVPGVLPPKDMVADGRGLRLVDGGLSDSLPLSFARSPGMDATHVIVSDCRLTARCPPEPDETLVYVRPDLNGIRPLRAPRAALLEAVDRGDAAVQPADLQRIDSWLSATR